MYTLKLQKTLTIINFEMFLGFFIDFKISRYVYQYIENKIVQKKLHFSILNKY